jgi:glucose/arabinose dehydrogenase
MRSLRHRPLWQLVVLGVLVVGLVGLVGGAGAAGACKFFFNCHLHSINSLQNEIGSYEGRQSRLNGLPKNLDVTSVGRGFLYPTDFDFLPDGRILVAEKEGTIRLVASSGRPDTQPFLDLRARMATKFFRGILGFAVDPQFASHPFVYVAYTPKLADENGTGPTVVRISRFRVVNDRADSSSERVIVGDDDTKPCADQPPSADCLPSTLDVDGADFAFAADGTLFVSTGFGGGQEHVEPSAFLSQDRGSPAGKILHIDRAGRGLPGNPYWDGDPGSNRSKVWASGFRNPFRIAMLPLPGATTTLAVGDVGWDSWEALFRVTRGGDYGWPCYEGGRRTPDYDDTAFCADYYLRHSHASSVPWVALPHPSAIAITAGVPLTRATKLPSDLRNDFVFADWAQGTLTLVPLSEARDPRQTPLAQSAAGPVRLRVGPDGALYYLAANSGELRRIAER